MWRDVKWPDLRFLFKCVSQTGKQMLCPLHPAGGAVISQQLKLNLLPDWSDFNKTCFSLNHSDRNKEMRESLFGLVVTPESVTEICQFDLKYFSNGWEIKRWAPWWMKNVWPLQVRPSWAWGRAWRGPRTAWRGRTRPWRCRRGGSSSCVSSASHRWSIKWV